MPQYLDEPKICIRGRRKSDQLQMLSVSGGARQPIVSCVQEHHWGSR